MESKERRVTRGRPKRSSAAPVVAAKSGDNVVGAAAVILGGRRSITANPTLAAAEPVLPATTARRASPSRTRTSPARRASPARTRTSPTRRSSRSHSATLSAALAVSVAVEKSAPSLKEIDENGTNSEQTNLPTALTTNTQTRAPHKVATTSSVHSSYSSTTQKTIEIRTSTADNEINKLSDYIRRSASKTGDGEDTSVRDGSYTPSQHTDGESRYSRSVSRSVYDDDRYSKAEFSDSETNDADATIHEDPDEEDAQEQEYYKSFITSSLSPAGGVGVGVRTHPFCRQLAVPREFGGSLGATALMGIVPILVYYLQWCCSEERCSFKLPKFGSAVLEVRNLVAELFKGEAVGAYLAFNFSIFALSTVLFGRFVRLPMDRGRLEYMFNGLPSAVLILLAAGVAEYLKYPVADFVLEHYLRFCVYGLLNAFVMALWAYKRADMYHSNTAQCNIYGKSGNFLVDYALGRQLNPKWLDLVEFKLVFYRISLISTLLYAVCLIYKNLVTPLAPLAEDGQGLSGSLTYILEHLKYDPTGLLCAGMLLLYVADAIVFEHHLASSFELQGEGFGCLLLLRYASTPYLLTAVAKYFFDYRTPMTCRFAAFVSITLLLAGLTVKRLSNAVKYKYRVQPAHPLFRNVDTIHTFQGRRLLLGAFWGRLRQPNYLGDTIALVALGLPLGLRFAWPPLVGLALLVVLLMHRAVRVNARNAARYHSSWVRYRGTVRYYMFPKIF